MQETNMRVKSYSVIALQDTGLDRMIRIEEVSSKHPTMCFRTGTQIRGVQSINCRIVLQNAFSSKMIYLWRTSFF
jgi:hypothetical protein